MEATLRCIGLSVAPLVQQSRQGRGLEPMPPVDRAFEASPQRPVLQLDPATEIKTREVQLLFVGVVQANK